MLKTFKELSSQNVKLADGSSKIIGQGTIDINLETTITMNAYYAADFSTNILATNIISDFFEVHMTSSLRPYKSCFLFKKGSLASKMLNRKQDVSMVYKE